MSTYEILSLVVSGISALFIGISLIYLAWQIKLFISAHADNHEWNRRIETQHAISKIRELDTDLLNEKFGYVNRQEPIPLTEVQEAFHENPSLQLMLHKLLNHYEGLANGVFLGTYDEATIKANRKGTMEREFSRFKHYIQYRRDQGNKTAWCSFERLIKKWHEESISSLDREPTGRI